MRIEINGEAREVASDVTIAALIAELGMAGALVAVERNEHIVPRASHATTTLSEGDRIEVVQFVGGG